MSIRPLIAALLLTAFASVQADEAVRALIERGAWKAAQSKVYDRAWDEQPTAEITISMACSGFLDLALLRVKDLPAIVRSYVLTTIGKDCPRLNTAERIDILNVALRTATAPDQRIWIALAWLQLDRPDQAIAIARSTFLEAKGSSQYTRTIMDALAFSQDASFATALAQEIVPFAHAMPGDNDPYIYIHLARLLGLAGDEKGQKAALYDAGQRVVYLPEGQRPTALRAMAEVALHSDQITLAASIISQENILMEWADYYARHADYKTAENLAERMGETLYVSHRQDSLAATIRKAVQNGDMRVAGDMTERLININFSYARLQLIIGNAYGKAYQKIEASKAYARGIAKYITPGEAYYSQSDVEVLAQLSQAARHNGEPVIADIAMALLPTLISKMHPHNLEAQVLSRVYFATMLSERGDRQAASTFLIEANELLCASLEPKKRLGFIRLEIALAKGLGDEMGLEVPVR